MKRVTLFAYLCFLISTAGAQIWTGPNTLLSCVLDESKITSGSDSDLSQEKILVILGWDDSRVAVARTGIYNRGTMAIPLYDTLPACSKLEVNHDSNSIAISCVGDDRYPGGIIKFKKNDSSQSDDYPWVGEFDFPNGSGVAEGLLMGFPKNTFIFVKCALWSEN